MKTACDIIQERLFEYDLLEPAELRQVENHLELCPACRQLHDELKGLDMMLSDIPRDPPADFTDRVMTAVTAPPAPDRTLPVLAALLLAEILMLVVAWTGVEWLWDAGTGLVVDATGYLAAEVTSFGDQLWSGLTELGAETTSVSAGIDWTYPIVAVLAALLLGWITVLQRGDDHA